MKILLLNQTFYPDAVATSQQLTDLAHYLTRQGHEVSVIAGRRGYENRDRIFSSFETYHGIKIYRVHSSGFGKQRFILRLFDAFTFDLMLLLKLVFFPKQDVVVSFTSPPLIGIFGALFCLFKGGRSVQWLMDINPGAAFAVGYIQRKSLIGRFLNQVFEVSLKLSSHVVVLDRWMKKIAVKHGVSEENVSIIHPWSPFEAVTEVQDPALSVFRNINRLQNKTVIMYSGNHSVVHPLYTLLDAAKQMKDDPSVVFVFVGGGLRSKEVATFKLKENLSNIVQLPLVPRELLSDALNSVDAHVVVMGEAVNGLVHTSKVYGALATGKPIIFIGPEKSHVMDVIKICNQGFHAEHGEVNRVVEAIKKIQKLNPEEAAKASLENKGFYTNQFSSKKCFAAFSQDVLKVSNSQPELSNPELSEQLIPPV
jgi:colanic acid biosynthesis glycosyl transferase WcaI